MRRLPSIRIQRLIVWTIIGTGITSVTTQLLTIREFLTQFHGNEIIISLVLFIWLLLSGLGSLLNTRVKRPGVTGYAVLMVIAGVWPLVQLLLIRGLREPLFGYGTSPGFYAAFFYILCLTAPYCLLIGFALPQAQKVILSYRDDFTSGHLYLTDSIGDIAGGMIFSFVLVYWVKPFAAIALTSAPLLFLGLCLLAANGRHVLLAAGLFTSALFFSMAAGHGIETKSLGGQYGDIVRYEESPYGRIVVSREGEQYTVWESGLPVYSGSDLIRSEEKIHFALSQLNRVGRVLLVSGGFGRALDEIAKYGPVHVDYVEMDPHLVTAAKGLGIIEGGPNLRIIHADGRRHIKTATTDYDAILIDLPDPSTFQVNRFFSSEFIGEAKRRLREGGVLSMSLEYSPDHISRVQQEKLSTLYRTLTPHFRNVAAIPGEKAYFVCRDDGLTLDIPSRLKGLGIETAYIEGYYHGHVTEDRKAQLRDALEASTTVNRDFEPKLIRIEFREWFAKYGGSPMPFVACFGALLALYLFFMKKEEYVLFSTGIAAMGVEMLVVFAFQVVYGYVYLRVGAIITVFLLGLLPGALAGRRLRHRGKGLLLVSECVMLALLALFAIWAFILKTDPGSWAFLAYGMAFSCLCGLQFPVAAHVVGESRSPAAGCLAADLCGAAVGTVVVGTFLIPFFGIGQAAVFLILVKTSSSMLLLAVKAPGFEGEPG